MLWFGAFFIYYVEHNLSREMCADRYLLVHRICLAPFQPEKLPGDETRNYGSWCAPRD